MKIHPETLRMLRRGLPLTQQALSELSGVSKKTVSRIETGQVDPESIRATTLERLAKALRVKPEALAKAPDDTTDLDALRRLGVRPFKTFIDAETALAYGLVARRYKVSPRSLIDMAPLFFSLLAEKSLSERRRRLEEIKSAFRAYEGILPNHLAQAGSSADFSDATREEHDSIAANDLFGRMMSENAFEFGFDPSLNNPFADFLKHFATEVDRGDDVNIGHEFLSDWKTPEGMPYYKVCNTDLERITDGDHWADHALTRGHVLLSEIPEELRGVEATDERIAWLTDLVPQEEREEWDRLLEAVKIEHKTDPLAQPEAPDA